MGIIHSLSLDLINKIAAGEVIESSHSVVKELVENSCDANATKIQIHATKGGLEKIQVLDNGNGILKEDLPLSIQRHTTSKIQNLNDLETLSSFGFRGEALASIASVSKLKIQSGTSELEPASEIQVEMSQILSQIQTTPRKGTFVEVRELFYNTPVRRKFLKSERSEESKIKERVIQHALSHPQIEFQLSLNDKEIFHLKPSNHYQRILDIFGENLEKFLLEVKLERRGIQAFGYISSPEFYKSNRTGQFTFINSRPVEIKYSSFMLKKAYDELLPSGTHPWCFLYFKIDPRYIDVNVHPTKKEIRFLDEEGFNNFFMELVLSTLRSKTPISFLELKTRIDQPIPNKSFSDAQRKNTLQQILHDTLYQKPIFEEGLSLENIGPGTQIEKLTDTPIKSREFIPKKHFGVLFETFILAEAEDGLYIIDQHTAHERIRYEEVLREMKNSTKTRQILLTPMHLEFSKQEVEEILQKKDLYFQLGIVIESFGDTSILVREVPNFLEPGTEREVIVEFLEKSINKAKVEDLYDLMAKFIACRSAIKRGDLMSAHIIAELLNRLSYCENPSRCPHGRPTLIKLTRLDLEKMFHRQ